MRTIELLLVLSWSIVLMIQKYIKKHQKSVVTVKMLGASDGWLCMQLLKKLIWLFMFPVILLFHHPYEAFAAAGFLGLVCLIGCSLICEQAGGRDFSWWLFPVSLGGALACMYAIHPGWFFLPVALLSMQRWPDMNLQQLSAIGMPESARKKYATKRMICWLAGQSLIVSGTFLICVILL